MSGLSSLPDMDPVWIVYGSCIEQVWIVYGECMRSTYKKVIPKNTSRPDVLTVKQAARWSGHNEVLVSELIKIESVKNSQPVPW